MGNFLNGSHLNMAPKELLLFIVPLNEWPEPSLEYLCASTSLLVHLTTPQWTPSTVKLEVMCRRELPPLLWIPVVEPLAWGAAGAFKTELEYDWDQNETSPNMLKQNMTSWKGGRKRKHLEFWLKKQSCKLCQLPEELVNVLWGDLSSPKDTSCLRWSQHTGLQSRRAAYSWLRV